MSLLDVITRAKEVLLKLPNSEADCARLEEYRSQLSQDIVTIAVVGEFSSGKSSLINALIGNQLLPVADRPLTSKRIEIRYSEKAMLSLHWSKPASAVNRRSLLEVFAALETRGTSLSVLSLKKRVSWNPESTVCSYLADNPETMASFLWVIENSRQQKANTVLPEEKKNRSLRQSLLTEFLRDTALTGIQGIVKILPNLCPNMISALLIKGIQRIWCDSSAKEKPFCQTDDIEKIAIGLPLPQFWENICLIDLPGAGSLHSYHLNTKTALETTQIVLHVLDAEHIGSKLTEELMSDFSLNKMTIYVLNKQDNTDPDNLKKCIAFLKKQYDITPQTVSALYENLALQLHNGSISAENVCNHPKVKLGPLICSPEWNCENFESNKEAIVSYLHKRSGIELLQDTLTRWLRESHPAIDDALAPAIMMILKKNLVAIQTLLRKVEHSPETEQLQQEIDRLRELSNNIETFLNDANEKYHGLFKKEISCAFDALYAEFRDTLSRALHTEFTKCEKNFKSVISEYFALPSFMNIKKAGECFFSNMAAELRAFVDAHQIELILGSTTGFSWKEETAFRDTIQKTTIKQCENDFRDTSDKPWFSAFRPTATAEYQEKKNTRCLNSWSNHLRSTFSREASRVLEENIAIFTALLSPLVKYRESIGEVISNVTSKLTSLQKKNEIVRDELLCIQNDITALITNIQNEGVAS